MGDIHPPGLSLQAAQDYAARGWHVFPCNPGDKSPLLKNGFYDASTDPTVIAAWWRENPYAMIGVRTGPESGIWVLDLDIDPDKKLNGIEAFHDVAQGRLLPESFKTRTPRGGTHIFFCWTDNITCSTGKLAPGVDTRGEGGYTILPPSMRSDRVCYQVLSDIYPDLPSAPDWLIAAILAAQTKRAPAPTALAQKRAINGGSGYASAALENECHMVASAAVGERNDTLNTAAFNLGQLIAAGILAEAEVRGRLTDAARLPALGARTPHRSFLKRSPIPKLAWGISCSIANGSFLSSRSRLTLMASCAIRSRFTRVRRSPARRRSRPCTHSSRCCFLAADILKRRCSATTTNRRLGGFSRPCAGSLSAVCGSSGKRRSRRTQSRFHPSARRLGQSRRTSRARPAAIKIWPSPTNC